MRFAEEHGDLIAQVLKTVQRRGPLRAGEIEDAPTLPTHALGTFRSGKLANQALYYLWLAGEVMTHSRKGIERVYDLRERIVPARVNYASTKEEADAFFALRVFREYGMLTLRAWRNVYAGTIERTVQTAEATDRLEALRLEGKIVPVALEDDPKTPRFILADDLPLLETVHAGHVPDAWQPIETATREEMTFLAPLEIAIATMFVLALVGGVGAGCCQSGWWPYGDLDAPSDNPNRSRRRSHRHQRRPVGVRLVCPPGARAAHRHAVRGRWPGQAARTDPEPDICAVPA